MDEFEEKEINYKYKNTLKAIIKNTRKVENQKNEAIKDRIIRDIDTLSKKLEDYY